MRYHTRHRPHHTLETIALTDIILNLFIFFFITFSLAYIPKTHQVQAAVAVELPRAGRGETAAPSPIVISLRADQEDVVFLGEQAISLGGLAAALGEFPPEQQVRGAVIRCDRRVSIERALQVIDALRRAGITSVSVATQPPAP
jgi:biopolymer transport protein ExbD